jgi:replicative DNA helicase
VVYASCEPRRPEWSQRALSFVSGVPLERVRTPSLRTHDDAEQVTTWRQHLRQFDVGLWYRPGASLLDVAAHARRAKLSAAGLDVLVVDYLQIMRHERAERADLGVGRTVGGLKALAGELGIAVVALSQINREGQKDAPRRGISTGRWWDAVRLPTTFDLKESGSIENDADVILFPVRADKAAPGRRPVEGTRPDDAVVVLAKQRNGPTGEVPVTWDGPCACYRDPVDDPLGPL